MALPDPHDEACGMSRKLFTFNGGIHPEGHKSESNDTPIRAMPLLPRYVVPMRQHIGTPARPLVAVGEQVLRGFDDEIRHFVAAEMGKHGVDLRLHSDVAEIQRAASGLQVRLANGDTLEVDAVLYATGRKPLVQGLGLDTLGVAQGKQGEVLVNERYQTNVPSVYALGDVTNRVQLTPVALGEDGATYNVNADTFAGAIAGAMKAKRLLLLTDVPGVLDKNKNLIPQLTVDQCRELIADGTVSGGMIPKIETCIYAIEQGVEGVVILDGKVPHAVLLELLTEHGAGTLITP
jgi:hypothetical protein